MSMASGGRSRPPRPSKLPKGPLRPKHNLFHKIVLTDSQRIKIEIIDWKRWAVRALLLFGYTTMAHLFAYPIVYLICFRIIFDSDVLIAVFSGFCLNLLVYFLGASASVRAITYAWNPIKFYIGIGTIIISIITNIVLFIIGTTTSEKYQNGVDKETYGMCVLLLKGKLNDEEGYEKIHVFESKKQWGKFKLEFACQQVERVLTFKFLLPFILPPLGAICASFAVYATYRAIYIVPRKVEHDEVKIDASWLEPYETYDFYVGRNIPKIPGYDEAFEGTANNTLKYSDSDSDENDDITLTSSRSVGSINVPHHDNHPSIRKSLLIANIPPPKHKHHGKH